MRILYITISYEDNQNGLYQNLVEELRNRGHEMTIVRSVPEANKTNLQKFDKTLTYLNVKTADPFEKNIIKKGISQISLAYVMKNAIQKYLKNYRFDLILYATPPVSLALVVKYCKNFYQARTFLMLKDIFPQNAVDLEMITPNGLIYRYFRHFEKEYYKYSDYIGCMSEGNKQYLLEHDPELDPKKIHVFPNTIKLQTEDRGAFHQEKTLFVFGGNLGKPQNISFLLNIISSLRDYPLAEFLIVGDGAEKNKITEFIARNPQKNFSYIPQLMQKDYAKVLENADVGIISLDPRFTIPNIPSRLLDYLNLRKPVLAITDDATDLHQMIESHQCGWWCSSKLLPSAVSLIKQICANKQCQIEFGQNGYRYLENEFNVKHSVDQIERFYNKK